MSVIKFVSRDDKVFLEKLADLRLMFAAIRKQNQAIKRKWVLMNRDGFIKVIEGSEDIPPVFSVAIRHQTSFALANVSALSNVPRFEKIDFFPERRLDDETILFSEMP